MKARKKPEDVVKTLRRAVKIMIVAVFGLVAILALHTYFENVREGNCQSAGRAWVNGTCIPICLFKEAE